MGKRFNHIELFAGCGGMSLGLDAAGFELFFANELSPMASETFAFNILGENLSALIDKKGTLKRPPEKVLWLKSKHNIEDLHKRLSENPFDFSNGKEEDVLPSTDLKGKLIVGDIKELVEFLKKEKNQQALKQVKNKVDLLSGGPPCQGFSLAGKRIKDDHKNQLPGWFAELAGIINPKVVLLENVKGITHPFKDNGKKYYAYLEVAKAFVLEGYVPVCMMVNSKYFKIPQNRPRFILVGLRERDIYWDYVALPTLDQVTKELLQQCHKFFTEVKDAGDDLDDIGKELLPLKDIEIREHQKYFNGQLLPSIVTPEGEFITAQQALANLNEAEDGTSFLKESNDYVAWLNSQFRNIHSFSQLENHHYRSHTPNVKSRFRLYQLLNQLNGIRNDAEKVFFRSSPDVAMAKTIFEKLKNEKFYLGEKNDLDFIKDFSVFLDYTRSLSTKKHSQRALRPNEPAPAQLTIPDDVCHYDPKQLRTLTVREMARLQSFPDWFVFKSNATTGGKMRKYQVPQYTQVGNAVPPLLAYQLGHTILTMLTAINHAKTKS